MTNEQHMQILQQQIEDIRNTMPTEKDIEFIAYQASIRHYHHIGVKNIEMLDGLISKIENL